MIYRQYNPEKRLVCFTVEGDPRLSEIVGEVLAWFNSEEFSPDVNALWDIRGATWDKVLVEFPFVESAVVDRINQFRPGGKVAWVFSSQQEAAIFDDSLANKGWFSVWRAFVDSDLATTWLLSD